MSVLAIILILLAVLFLINDLLALNKYSISLESLSDPQRTTAPKHL